MRYFTFSFFLLLSTLAHAYAENIIGRIQNAQGESYIVRSSLDIIAENGSSIREKDILKTGHDGAMGIIFKDNSRISMGPNSKLDMKKFEFSPKDSHFAFITNMLKGTFVYASGLIAKLSPDSVRIESPVASIGIRGTKVLIKVEK